MRAVLRKRAAHSANAKVRFLSGEEQDSGFQSRLHFFPSLTRARRRPCGLRGDPLALRPFAAGTTSKPQPFL
jgi:hypothetical protein